MPGRHPRGPDDWDGDEGAGAGPADRAGDREPGIRADYHTEQGLTPEDREAIGDIDQAAGRDSGGSYAPTAEEAIGRKPRDAVGPDDPGGWFGKAPNAPKPRRSPASRRPRT